MNVQIEVSQNTIRIILPFDASPNIIVKNESKIPLQSEQQIITKKKPIYPITSQYSYFIFKNETVSEYKQIDLLITLLKLFDSMDESFYDRYCLLPTHGRTRRYIAKTIHGLNPSRKDLAEQYNYKLRDGYWLDTNVSATEKSRIVNLACDVMGIKLGSELKINWGR